MKILYAEDDLKTQEAVLYCLSNIDFVSEIDVATNGEEALNLYNSNKNYDVILTDINMPGKNGLEFIDDIDEKDEVFSIIFTAYNDPKYLLKSIDLKISKYLLKPIRMNDLEDVLICALDFKTQLENKKQEKQKAIQEERFKASNELLNSLAHHWRQYLNVISVEASAMKYLNSDNEAFKDQTFSLDNIIKTTSNLSELLDKFKFEKEFIEENINLEKFIYTLMDEKKETFDTYNIKIKESLQDNLTVKTQVYYLENIIVCIMKNSIDQFGKKNKEDKIISIEIIEKENEIDILIKDNAGGIATDILDKIFEPYTTTKFQSKDTGLSLYICKNVANHLLKGSLFAKNIDGGALFTISLPK